MTTGDDHTHCVKLQHHFDSQKWKLLLLFSQNLNAQSTNALSQTGWDKESPQVQPNSVLVKIQLMQMVDLGKTGDLPFLFGFMRTAALVALTGVWSAMIVCFVLFCSKGALPVVYCLFPLPLVPLHCC